MRVAEGVSKYLPTKHAMKLRKCPRLCYLLKWRRGEAGEGVQFFQKNKLKSETFNNKNVDNFFNNSN